LLSISLSLPAYLISSYFYLEWPIFVLMCRYEPTLSLPSPSGKRTSSLLNTFSFNAAMKRESFGFGAQKDRIWS